MSLSSLQLIGWLAAMALGCTSLGAAVMRLLMRIEQLKTEVAALKAELSARAAERAGTSPAPTSRKRMPYEAAEEVIDAMSVLDAAYEKGLLQVEYVQNVKSHLARALESGTKRASPGGDLRSAPVRDESEL